MDLLVKLEHNSHHQNHLHNHNNQGLSDPSNKNNSRSYFWDKTKTIMLIEEYRSIIGQFKEPYKKHKNLWDKVATRMQYRGVNIDSNGCGRKWRNLKTTFRKIYYDRERSITSKSQWAYYDDLIDIFTASSFNQQQRRRNNNNNRNLETINPNRRIDSTTIIKGAPIMTAVTTAGMTSTGMTTLESSISSCVMRPTHQTGGNGNGESEIEFILSSDDDEETDLIDDSGRRIAIEQSNTVNPYQMVNYLLDESQQNQHRFNDNIDLDDEDDDLDDPDDDLDDDFDDPEHTRQFINNINPIIERELEEPMPYWFQNFLQRYDSDQKRIEEKLNHLIAIKTRELEYCRKCKKSRFD